MKYLKKIIFGASLIAVGSLTSCNTDLTTPTQSSFDESVVFANYQLAEYNVFSIYEVFGHTNCHRGRYLPWYGFNTDIELYLSTTVDDKSDIVRYAIAADNGQLNLDNGPYNELLVGVERANLCIKGIRQYGNVETNPQMAMLLGEALTARALLYTELLKAYGEVPARFEPIGPETIYVNKTDKDVIFKQLLGDLEEAFKYMKWPKATAATSTTDRPSLAFAKGLYARLALMASGYSLRPEEGKVGTGDPGSVRLSNDPELSKEVLYPKAFAALKDVIDNAGLSLMDYEQLWKNFNNMDLEAGKEIIYSLPLSDSRGRWNYTFAIRNEGTTVWSPTTSNRGGTAGPTPHMYWKYGNNDVRRDISCANFKFTKDKADQKDKQVLAGVDNWYFGKFRFDWMQKAPYTGGNDDGIKPVYMRYSDILLMAAEIANSSAMGSARDENYAKARLLEVRKRAYKGHEAEAEAYVNALSGEQKIFDAIVDERALEFVGEMLRKQDLIRWNILKEKMDEANAELKKFYNREAPYNNFGPAVWYKYASDGITLETFGYKPGQLATTSIGPEGEGWQCYTDSKGAATEYFKLGETGEKKIGSFYDKDPNTRQWWPIPAITLTNSQGSLKNDYGF